MSKNLTVLIIDDDNTVRKIFTKQLEKLGVHVISTCCAEEGMKIVEEQKPAITFVDFIMPEMGGDEMLIRISEKKLFHCSSFYLYTAQDLDDTKTFELMTLGFTHLLKKPMADSEIIEILQNEGVLVTSKAA